jgi:hypothetical protein
MQPFFCNFAALILIDFYIVMELYFTGIIIAVSTFLAIGIFHPVVVKTEYYFGTRPWLFFLLLGIGLCICALFIENVILSSVTGVVGASALWSIGELFSQRKRVMKGWFPMNPKRRSDYGEPCGKCENGLSAEQDED